MFDLTVHDLFVQREERRIVACLRCGYLRKAERSVSGRLEPAECPLCSYVGWREPSPAIVRSRRPGSGGRGDLLH